MTGASITRKRWRRLSTAALLLVVQSLHAATDAAKQAPETAALTSKPVPVMEAEKEDSQPPSAVEVAPVSVPVSDAVQAAAALMRPSGATLDQVVAAMIRLNPAVFDHGDLQHVTFSAPLTVPSPEEILREDPAGLSLLLQQLDIVAAASSSAGFADSAVSRQAVKEQQAEAAAPRETLQERITATQIPAAKSAAALFGISSGGTVIGVGVALLLLMWILFRFGRSRSCAPLSTSSSVKSPKKGPLLAVNSFPDTADAMQHRPNTLPYLPVEYINYDDIEVLLQRVIGESPDATLQVLQLMRLFQLRQDREGFQRQHEKLVTSGIYHRHAELWSTISQAAAELGLKLNATTAAADPATLREKLRKLEERVEMAENARIEAEQRALKAERSVVDVELKLKEMQLQLDFGEMESQ